MMTRTKNILFLVLGSFLILACIEEFNPEINNYENMLVVDGGISDQEGPHTVRLSLTSSVANPEFIPVDDAEVWVVDDMGNRIPFMETEPGTYQSNASIKGVVGRAYKIEVQTAGGKSYDSEFELMKTPIGIDTVYHEIVIRQESGYDYDLYGYEFYVDTKPGEERENYFKWDLDATYQYQSEYTIRWYYDGELKWFHGPDSLFNCWKSYKVGSIFVAGTSALSDPVIIKYPFHFVSTESRLLSVRYSLMVKQHNISREAFEYWQEVNKQNGDDATLYATQPHFIRGNVYNIADPDELVVGYFTVSSLDEMRIFVDRPPYYVPMRYPVCTLSEADFMAYGDLFRMDPSYYPIYAIETNGGRRAVPNQNCVDCRRKGGTIEKPGFWIDPY